MPSKAAYPSKCACSSGFETLAVPPPDFSWKITADPEARIYGKNGSGVEC
jgi:hypothetical protein